MSWREDKRPGSFRGIPFETDRASSIVGRRTQVNELAASEKVNVQDLGKRARRFHLTCWVAGENYMIRRDALVEAFELPGSGTLVHPWWGELRVQVDGDVALEETTDEGGVCKFELNVVEVVEQQKRPLKLDTRSRLKTAAGRVEAFEDDFPSDRRPRSALELASRAFEPLFTVPNLTSLLQREVLSKTRGVLSAFRATRRAIATTVGALDAIETLLDQVENEITALVRTPYVLATKLARLYLRLTALMGDAQKAFENGSSTFVPEYEIRAGSSALSSASSSRDVQAPTDPEPTSASGGDVGVNPAVAHALSDVMERFSAYSVGTTSLTGVEELTPAQERAAQAFAALERLVRCVSVVSCCVAASDIRYASSDDVVRVRDTLVDALDVVAAEASTDELYGALVELRAELVRHLSDTAGTLPRVSAWTPGQTMPALLIAHLVYGDARREAELVERNGVHHPAFVAGGVALEVLDG